MIIYRFEKKRSCIVLFVYFIIMVVEQKKITCKNFLQIWIRKTIEVERLFVDLNKKNHGC